MNRSGIVRKIDDLGRIVIPIEIRKQLKINEKESLEIIMEGDKIVLLKNEEINKEKRLLRKIVLFLHDIFNYDILITNKSDYILMNGISISEEINEKMIKILKDNSIYMSKEKEMFCINNVEINGYFYINPIVVDSDNLGYFIIWSDLCNDKMFELCKRMANFIARECFLD